MKTSELKTFLDEKVEQYQQPAFLENDPVQIPHGFRRKEDIEVSGLLTATIAWGNRKSILNSARQMMSLLDGEPYEFCMQASSQELRSLRHFKHRTFNGIDFKCFVLGLRGLYQVHGGLEGSFTHYTEKGNMAEAISSVRELFFSRPHPPRSEKHFSNPARGSAAKRLNMFLRWMVRSPEKGVDFGLWKGVSPAQLSCPLDVHSGTVARALGLLKRKQNDARAVAELDRSLRKLDPEDPVKYDFALFGLGVFEGFPG